MSFTLTAEFDKHFSLFLIPLYDYDTWQKLCTMGAIFRMGIMSFMYKFRL